MSLLKSKVFIISMAILAAVAIITPTTIILLKDNIPPTVAIINPLDGYGYSGTIVIEIEAEDDSKIDTVGIYIDGVLESEYTSYSWYTTDYLDGYHNITAVASDKAGNTDVATINCTVDNFIDPPPADEFKVLNYNIKESGVGEEWLEVVKAENPDIAIFVETGQWNVGGDSKLNTVINKLNGYFYEEAHYEGYTAQGNSFYTTGEAILSRYPILEFNQIETLTLDDASSYTTTHDFIHAIVNIQGKLVNIIGYHLKAGSADDGIGISNNGLRRNWEQEGIINYMDSLGNSPIMYIGDLNSLSPSDVNDTTRGPYTNYGYGPATMMLEPDDEIYGNYSSKVHNFTDVWKTLHPSSWGHTFNIPGFQARIDYIFVNQHLNTSFISSNIGSGTELDDTASDHYTLDAVFSVANISSTPYAHKIQLKETSKNIIVEINEKQTIENHIEIEFYLHVNWVKRLRFI